AALRELVAWVRHLPAVIDDWGARPIGGPVALFAGPSGTGKTFAAAVVATELDWALVRVDLGLLVSKYIGETEKNLNRLLAAAEGAPIGLRHAALAAWRELAKDGRDLQPSALGPLAEHLDPAAPDAELAA